MNWLKYETEQMNKGYHSICGIDEAGRGPLAGPVFAAAVILPKGELIEGINDSKKLSEKKRDFLFDQICTKAVSFHVASASVEEIDSINILNATFLAMNRAVGGLKVTADFALVDGNMIPKGMAVPSACIIRGDGLSASIAAASILAKVSRDRYMLTLGERYPAYQFGKHKGYGTKLHREMILAHGASSVHRKTFLRKILGELDG